MKYNELDYVAAKLRGEVQPRDVTDYVEQWLLGQKDPIMVPISVMRYPAESCEQWLARMNK